jgi:hypothetical protein
MAAAVSVDELRQEQRRQSWTAKAISARALLRSRQKLLL